MNNKASTTAAQGGGTMNDTTIKELQGNAWDARDYVQVDICTIALGYSIHSLERENVANTLGIKLARVTKAVCRAECERVINEAAQS